MRKSVIPDSRLVSGGSSRPGDVAAAPDGFPRPRATDTPATGSLDSPESSPTGTANRSSSICTMPTSAGHITEGSGMRRSHAAPDASVAAATNTWGAAVRLEPETKSPLRQRKVVMRMRRVCVSRRAPRAADAGVCSCAARVSRSGASGEGAEWGAEPGIAGGGERREIEYMSTGRRLAKAGRYRITDPATNAARPRQNSDARAFAQRRCVTGSGELAMLPSESAASERENCNTVGGLRAWR